MLQVLPNFLSKKCRTIRVRLVFLAGFIVSKRDKSLGIMILLGESDIICVFYVNSYIVVLVLINTIYYTLEQPCSIHI